MAYAQQPAVSEYELKAVYLYNFLQFIQWPEASRDIAKDGSLVIGIVGDSPFGTALEALQSDVRTNGLKPIKIINYGPYRDDMNLRTCQLLFISSTEKRNFTRIIAGLRGAPVLTVAETEGFVSSGGMIGLINSKGKIRWVINRTQTDKAGLKLNSQLLNIAAKVIEE